MPTITDLPLQVQMLFKETANELAKKSGFVQRQRQLSGAGFAQAVVFGQLSHAQATRRQLHQQVIYVGEEISHQGFDKRFNAAGVVFLEALLGQCLQSSSQAVPAVAGLLGQFEGVYVVDSTDLGNGQKLMTCLNLSNGHLQLEQVDSHVHDNAVALAHQALPAGALRLADLGFYDFAAFDRYAAAGVFWVSRYKVNTRLWSPDTQAWLDLPALLQQHDRLYLPVQLAGYPHLTLYLVAQRVAPQVAHRRQARRCYRARRQAQPVSTAGLQLAHWELYLTNIPHLTVPDILALAHTRWQIELVFKLWKSELAFVTPQSENPVRQRCLFLAKLLALWLAHRLFALDPHPNRSWWQALFTLRLHLPAALLALTSLDAWHSFLLTLQRHLQLSTRMSKRKFAPLTFQALGAFP